MALLRQIEVEIAKGKSNPSLQGSRDHGSDVLPLEKKFGGLKLHRSERAEGARSERREAKAFSGGAVFGGAS